MTKIYKAGTILLLERGEYSDFGWAGHLVTLQELDIKAAANEFDGVWRAKQDPEKTLGWEKPDIDEFVGWLCSTQRCAALDCETLHIGTYDGVEIE